MCFCSTPQVCQRSHWSTAWRIRPWRETTSPWPAPPRGASLPPTCAGSGTRRRLKVRKSCVCGKLHQIGQASSHSLDGIMAMIIKFWQSVNFYLQKQNMFKFLVKVKEAQEQNRWWWFFWLCRESNGEVSTLPCWARWAICLNCLNRISPLEAKAARTWNELYKKAWNIIKTHRDRIPQISRAVAELLLLRCFTSLTKSK